MKMIKTYEYTVDTAGGIYGLANIQTVLGIIVLILTIFNILFKMCIAIYNSVKKRKLEEISPIIEHSIDEINKTVEDFKELEGDNNENK